MKNLYIVCAVRRSGRHAVINWLCFMMPNALFPTVLANINSTMKREDVLMLPLNCWYSARSLHYRNNKRFWVKLRDKSIAADVEHFDNIVIGLEDIPPKIYNVKDFDVHNVLIVRDPYNWLASALKHRTGNRDDWPDKIAIWKSHIREALGETNIFGNGAIIINYNKWCKDRGYRQDIANKFGLEYGELGLDDVIGPGGGSSFDLFQFDGRGSEMDVLNRFRDKSVAANIKQYVDSEMIELGKRYFDMRPKI